MTLLNPTIEDQSNFQNHDGVNSPLINKDANNIPNVLTGIDTPTNTKTVPIKLGDEYIDTVNRKVYKATLISLPPAVSDWSILN